MTLGQVGVIAAQLGQDGRPFAEPGSFLVTGEDNLRINSWASVAGLVVTITVRFLTDKGEIVPYVYTHTPNSNRTKATSDFPLGVGFPLNVQAVVSTGTPIQGSCFIQAQIIRGFGGGTVALAVILQDYITSVQAASWPGSPIRSSTDGEGALRSITGTAPGAGVEFSESVPTGARWQMLSFRSQINCSATVANRQPELIIDDGTNEYQRISALASITANGIVRVSYIPGSGFLQSATAGSWVAAIGEPVMALAGHRFRSSTTNLQVGDSWAAPQYLVREYLEAAA